MLSFPAAVKVYLCTVACDMRRSFYGLSMMAEHVIRCNPFSGHLLVFCNRRSDRLKILYWDRDGWAIWYKRLEVGTFQFINCPHVYVSPCICQTHRRALCNLFGDVACNVRIRCKLLHT